MKEYLEKILKSFKDLIKKLIDYKKMKAFLIFKNNEIKNQNLLFIGEEDFDENFQENIERDFEKD